MKFRKTIVQRVTVVELGVYDGGGNCFGGVKVKVHGAESTNVMVAGFRQCRYLIRKGKMFVSTVHIEERDRWPQLHIINQIILLNFV